MIHESVADNESVWEEMSRELASELAASDGDPARERVALAKALARYARARAFRGERPFEFAEHFFGADGVAIGAKVRPALLRPLTEAATFERWMKTLEGLPHRLDLLDDESRGS